MLYKIIQFGAILWCSALSFESTVTRLPIGDGLRIVNDFRDDDKIGYRLPNDTKPETYNISLRTGISEGKFDYDGFISINILIVNATREVTIHSRMLKIESIRLSDANGMGQIDLLPWRTNKKTGFLIIPTKSVELSSGRRHRLDIKFSGVLDTETRGFFRTLSDENTASKRWVATTFFEPFSARYAFPCYDEPGLKANVTIQIRHGANYSAVSNMPGTQSENSDGTATTRFETSPLMSTYLIAFAVTDFRFRANEANSSLPMRVFATPNAYNRTGFLLSEGEKAVKALENYLQVPYALPKLDQIALNNQPGAMENWGLIAYHATFLIDENATDLETRMRLFATIAHEISHQWFGNVITPKWWTYTWLKEGFAQIFQNIVIDLIYPESRIFEIFAVETLQTTLIIDLSKYSQPITLYVENDYGIMTTFSSLIYHKGASVIRMFIHALTEATFKKGITKYLINNSYSTVTEDDLFGELDRAAKEDGTLNSSLSVKELFSTWSRQVAYPMLTVTRNYENGSITISQERYTTDRFSNLTNATTWWIPYNFASAESLTFNDTKPDGWLAQYQRTTLIEPNVNNSWASTEWILFNKQQTGYYRVMYDSRNWKLLCAELASGNRSRIHPINRSQLLDDMKSFVQTGRWPFDMLIEMVRYLKFETDYAPWVAGSKALLYLNERLASTDDYESFRRMTVTIIRSAEKRLAVKSVRNESQSHLFFQTRAILTTLACRFGIGSCENVANDETEIDHFDERRGRNFAPIRF